MPTALLATKLFIPTPRVNLIPRARLVQRLDDSLHSTQKLTIISAPAGFGKSTLLGEWAAASDHPFAWLSLDEEDNDPARFLAYFAAALQKLETASGDGSKDTLQSARLLPGEDLLAALLNQMSAIPGRAVIVLDDYHQITAQPIHRALTYLVEHLPPAVHLVIATRTDPSLPLGRLRGRGELTELRQQDLRFTPQEAASFIQQVMGLHLSAEQVQMLTSRTEGWIAGIQMAALALQAQPDTAGESDITNFLHAFSGSNRYILDYLIEEVLRQQPEPLQSFLLQTSILDRLSAPLCAAILEPPPAGSEPSLSNCQQNLETLEKNNLFVVPLDAERRWYRYHNLFADLLRQRLQQSNPHLIPQLHRRASAWFEQNGLGSDAIEHALAGEDFGKAADLLENYSEISLMRGEFFTFLNYLQALPQEFTGAHPLLLVYHVFALLFATGSLNEIEQHLRELEKLPSIENYSGLLAILQSTQALMAGDARKSIELSQAALDRLPKDKIFFRGMARRNLASSYLLAGDLPAARRVFDEDFQTSQAAGDQVGAIAAMYRLGVVELQQGKLGKAVELFEKTLELSSPRGARRRLMVAIKALAMLGDVQRERNQLEAAERNLLEAVEVARSWQEVWAVIAYAVLAQVRQAQGNPRGARQAIQTARQMAAELDSTQIDDIYVLAYQARLQIEWGDLAAATRWAEERKLLTPLAASGRDALMLGYLRAIEQTVFIRLLIAQGQPGKALELVEELLPPARAVNRLGYEIELLALRARSFHQMGRQGDALDALAEALKLAEPEGYCRIFVDEGAPMLALLQQAAARGIMPEYTARLLSALQPKAPAASPSPATLPEPLSERELDVLRLLDTELTSSEIARELYVSANTVRTHQKSIYGKLGAHSRYEAVTRARQLGLLR